MSTGDAFAGEIDASKQRPSITVEGLRREFGAITALDGVEFSVDGPEIVGLAGPNGSGKTTLIRCLLGLLAPTAGSTWIDGTDSRAFTASDRTRLGYMPQHEAVYRDLTVRQNVAFFARLYGVQDHETSVDRALGFVDLRGRADARIGELSGGKVRRTSLACALVHDPDVVVLDEPTVGLDPMLRADMWEGFRERRDSGAVVVVSTHYLGEARNCDRVLFLRDGRVVAFDTPAALMATTSTNDLETAFLDLVADDGVVPTGQRDSGGSAPADGPDTKGGGDR